MEEYSKDADMYNIECFDTLFSDKIIIYLAYYMSMKENDRGRSGFAPCGQSGCGKSRSGFY